MPTFTPSARICSGHNSTPRTEQTTATETLPKAVFTEGPEEGSRKPLSGPHSFVLFCTLTAINSCPVSYGVFSPPRDLRCQVKLPLVRGNGCGPNGTGVLFRFFGKWICFLGNQSWGLLAKSIPVVLSTLGSRSDAVCLRKTGDWFPIRKRTQKVLLNGAGTGIFKSEMCPVARPAWLRG